MLAHIIQHKGKGTMVVALPCVVAFILFLLFSNSEKEDIYIRDASLIVSSVILFFVDNKKEPHTEGVVSRPGKRKKRIHQLMWIDMKYWAILMGVIGTILLIKDFGSTWIF